MSEVVAGEALREQVLEQLVQIWREVLKVEDVAVDEALPDLGARSILIVELAVRIKDRLGADVPLEEFLAASSLREFAGTVAALRDGTARP
ncbi:phosphopantetheine-binding protein [Micromonospora zamorensis]|uniref:phosphopantetheine-binding protein n=1 Tax=Micromonospora zamorensis TaxID=709883 RepID=UPI00352AF293|nr:phosphopantetheine-binding protein [Micromonospora zamorensis]